MTTDSPTRPRTRDRARRSTLDRATADRLAATEYLRVHDALAALTAEQWSLPTPCPGWDVRALATHVLGMAEMSARTRENLRQNLAARRRGGLFIDALTALQVEERAHLSPSDIVAALAAVGPRAARARARTPAVLRRVRMPLPEPFPGDEAWTYGYLVETIMTRDPWMHRVDLADATGQALHLTPGHDGAIVADVVGEWAVRHGRPCAVMLTGPAGGQWSFGRAGPRIELDAIEFCRRVSGRTPADGLLTSQVPF